MAPTRPVETVDARGIPTQDYSTRWATAAAAVSASTATAAVAQSAADAQTVVSAEADTQTALTALRTFIDGLTGTP